MRDATERVTYRQGFSISRARGSSKEEAHTSRACARSRLLFRRKFVEFDHFHTSDFIVAGFIQFDHVHFSLSKEKPCAQCTSLLP